MAAQKKTARTPSGARAGGRIAVYPGTFDPVTNGHMDIIARSLKIVDRLVVAVAVNAGKGPLFSLKERTEMCRAEVAALDTGGAVVDVVPFDNLLMDFVVGQGANLIIRGLRAVSDFEYEFQMAGMNRKIYPDVETVFLTPAEQYMFISATMVREIASMGGDVAAFVNPIILPRMARMNPQ